MASSTDMKDQAGRQERLVSASGATRVVLLLLAVWTVFFGLALTFVQETGPASLGASGEGEAARRLLGIHVLALAPIYGLLGWNPRKYGVLLWLPYATQFGIVAAILFDLVANDLDVGDAWLPLVVSGIFLALLLYLWRAGRQPAPREPAPGAAAGAPSPDATAGGARDGAL